MGSSFFKNQGQPKVLTGGNPGLEARAIGSSSYGVKNSAIGAQKALAGAQAANKAAMSAHSKPLKGSAAYPKGPKL
jgi:hypothetical protein